MNSRTSFDVWGCRGSRSSRPGRSRIGSYTSCYSLRADDDLFVFDAGRGLAGLADATVDDPNFAGIARVHLLITHAHLDHWEGLKDAGWFWTPNNGLEVNIIGPREALTTIVSGLAPPAFVPLELLAAGTVAKLTWIEVHAGETLTRGDHKVEALQLNHYSGMRDDRRDLDTLGYRVTLKNGASVAYLSDHEPIPETQAMEDAAASHAKMLVIDSQFADRKDQQFGHGSQEHAASCARRHASTLVVVAHHGPRSDDQIEEAHRRHGAGLDNLVLAIEGRGFDWDERAERFVSR